MDFKEITFVGKQAVTVKLKEKDAEALIKAGKIRIGLNLCPIVEYFKLTQCFKCFNYGHRKNEYVSVSDRTKECIKCG